MFPKPILLIAFVALFTAIDFVKNVNPPVKFTSLITESAGRLLIPSLYTNKSTDTSSPEKISYTIVNAKSNTYGYDIYINDKRYIHQLTIPGIPGNNGFRNKPDAEKTAKLVVDKMKRGEMPPTVTVTELQHLHIKQ